MPILRRLSIILIAVVLSVGCTVGVISEETESLPAASEELQPSETQASQTLNSEEPLQQAEETVGDSNQCLECHSDQQRLIETADPTPEQLEVNYWDQIEPMEAWEKVFVDKEQIKSFIHGVIPCSDCHGGQPSSDKLVAHEGLVSNPSQNDPNVCSNCHPNITDIYSTSLHASLIGFSTAVEARSTPENHPILEETLDQNCTSCHTTCGDCHVSRPEIAGGGFFNGHLFMRTPPMVDSCIACHSNTIGAEYLGMNESYPADVHLSNGNMECVDCHSEAQMHGQPANCSECHTSPPSDTMPPPDHRYAGVQSPSCLSCHAAITVEESDIPIHQVHGAQLACQVCHTVAYTNCEGCHLSASGDGSYRLEDSYLSFMLGLNAQRTFTRPYKYIPLRHVPVTPEMYSAYGENLLPNFNLSPTWTYTTPHNIQRYTFQAAGCNYCHGNSEIFLTEDKVDPGEIEANLSVIVPQIPAPVGSEAPIAVENQEVGSP